MIHFTQLNQNKALLAATSLAQSFQGKSLNIALISEPYIAFGRPASLPVNTKAYSVTDSPRTAIIASRDLSLTLLPSLSNRDCTVTQLNMDGRKFLIASIYMDILRPVSQQFVHKVIDFATSRRLELIMAADTNAHSSIFGPHTNKRGEALEELIAKHGLRVENQGNTPTFCANRRGGIVTSFIDYTLTKFIEGPVDNWRVDEDFNGSDHNRSVTVRAEL